MPPTGSVEGGTLLYIKGFNFNPMAINNKITIGPYPCIPEPTQATEYMVVCATTKPTNSAQMTRLQVKLAVGTKSATCTLDSCLFDYTLAATPRI